MAYLAKVIRGADTADKTVTPQSIGVEPARKSRLPARTMWLYPVGFVTVDGELCSIGRPDDTCSRRVFTAILVRGTGAGS